MHYSSASVADLPLSHLTTQDLSIVIQNVLVLGASPVSYLSVLYKPQELDLWQQEAEHLLAGPKRLWLQNGWLRDVESVVDPQHEVHQVFVVDEGVSLGEQ